MDDELTKLAQRVLDDYDWPAIAGHPEPVQTLARAVLEQDAQLARLQESNRILAEAVEDVEWLQTKDDGGVSSFCPWCGSYEVYGHNPDCLRQRALVASRDNARTSEGLQS